jgi:hypothetical protein
MPYLQSVQAPDCSELLFYLVSGSGSQLAGLKAAWRCLAGARTDCTRGWAAAFGASLLLLHCGVPFFGAWYTAEMLPTPHNPKAVLSKAG